MIKIENYEVVGWEHAIRGMRNPKNSWDRSDSNFKEIAQTDVMEDGDIRDCFVQFDALNIGPNDHKLAMELASGGPVHAKYRRMITVYVDITAPLYWWKEFDTYKVGTVANSCSTMHKIHAKEFTIEDFSCEHLMDDYQGKPGYSSLDVIKLTINVLNRYREHYVSMVSQKVPHADKKAKELWWQMIQLLPSSYNQKRTVMLNYEVLVGIYKWRKNHKLDEWRTFCEWIESLPYSEIITGEEG